MVRAATRRPGLVEEPAFYPYLTGRANLELLAEIDDGATPDIRQVLERVGLAHRGQDRVATYSTGMRQRLGIAAAVRTARRESTSRRGLDPASAEQPPRTASLGGRWRYRRDI